MSTTDQGAKSLTLSGAHLILELLAARGVRHLFGVPGHGAYPIYDALHDVPSITPIVGRHEQGSTFSAIGYSWAGGDFAVATGVPEAGLTNASTGLLEATLSQDRVLYVVEQSPMHAGVIESVSCYYRSAASFDDIAPALNGLVDSLLSGRPGAAVLEVPESVLTSTGEASITAITTPAQELPLAEIEIALERIERPARTAIIVGATGLSAGITAELQTLAEKLNAMVVTDGFAKGVIDENHRLSAGRAWTPTGRVQSLLKNAETVIVIGAPVAAAQNRVDWDPLFVTSLGDRDALEDRLILIDWDDTVQKELPGSIRLRGPVRSIIRALAEGVPSRPTEAWLQDPFREVREAVDDLVPWAAEAFRGIRRAVPESAVLLTDSLIGIWLDRLYPVTSLRRFRFPWGTGTLGFGIPASVGVKLAKPDEEVVVIGGDGAFLYNEQELATLQRHGLKVTVIVANDNCYSAIKYNMRASFGRSLAHDLNNPDFVSLGRAFGFSAEKLTDPSDLEGALGKAMASDLSTLIELPMEVLPPYPFFTWNAP